MTINPEATARALVPPGKGILAADESTPTIGKRFGALGIENTEANRRLYRQMLFTTRGIGGLISGVILFDETLRQQADDGTPFPELLARQDIIPGIKVDRGTKPLAGSPGEVVTEGLDGLRERLAEYRALGSAAGYYDDWQAGRDPVGISTQDDDLAGRFDPVLGGRRLANYLRVLTLEAQTLARACGKSHVHNLEPEDLVALTVEAAAMARVPLAGTSWIPGAAGPGA